MPSTLARQAQPGMVTIVQVIVFMIYFLLHTVSARTLGFVALQRKTADNFCLAMRAALGNSAFVRM
jgi:hypothetical protein